MKTTRLLSILLVFFFPLALRSCFGPDRPPPVPVNVQRTNDAAATQSEVAMLATERELVATIITRTPVYTPAPATPTDIFALGATPEAAALDTLKAWATVPYRNEQAQVVSRFNQQAIVKVSAEFKDNSSGAWILKEAQTQCGMTAAGWKCLPTFNFELPATPTPAP